MDQPPPRRLSADVKPESPQRSYSSESDLKPGASQSGAKRRPSRAGMRSVATLTPEALERKRANDREAQRAIRQRTKDHIDSLERKIAELSSDDRNTRLVRALQRVDLLEQENATLRARVGESPGVYTPSDDATSPTGQPPNKQIGSLTTTRPSHSLTPRLSGMHASPSPVESWQSAHGTAPLSEVSTHSSQGGMHADSAQQPSHAGWPTGVPRLSPHQDGSTHGMHQMGGPGPSQAGQSGYGYMLDAASTRTAQYGSPEPMPMQYEHGQQGYGQAVYQPRTMAPDINPSQPTAAYGQYQGQQGYLSDTQHQQPSSDPQHMMYNMSRPG